MQTILIAKNRATGKDELLAGRTVHLSEQKQMLREMYGPHNDTYSEAVVAYVSPCGPIMKFAASTSPRKPIHSESETIKTTKHTKSKH